MFRGRWPRERCAPPAIDPKRLPPGQYMTTKWPVLHAGQVPKIDLTTWSFRVFGEVEHEVELTWEQFNELPRASHGAGHPLRHALEPLRRAVRGRPLERAREPLPAAARPHASRSRTPSTASPRTCRLSAIEDDERAARDPRRRRAADTRPRLAAAPRRSRAVLLEERQVAARDRALPGRPARLLGALRLPQRRRSLAGAAIRASR